jgi:hypothetical protein
MNASFEEVLNADEDLKRFNGFRHISIGQVQGCH